MSNDNESTNGFTKPVMINELPDLSHNRIKIGEIASDVTLYELHNIAVLLKMLESEVLPDITTYQIKLVTGCYEAIRLRNERYAPARELVKRINTLNKIIDNTLDDLEAIYKETGLDSVGVLIENVRAAR